MSENNNEFHVISTTDSQVYLVATEYDGERRTADDAEEMVTAEYPDGKPHQVFYEGLLSDSVSEANRDGIALLRD